MTRFHVLILLSYRIPVRRRCSVLSVFLFICHSSRKVTFTSPMWHVVVLTQTPLATYSRSSFVMSNLPEHVEVAKPNNKIHITVVHEGTSKLSVLGALSSLTMQGCGVTGQKFMLKKTGSLRKVMDAFAVSPNLPDHYVPPIQWIVSFSIANT